MSSFNVTFKRAAKRPRKPIDLILTSQGLVNILAGSVSTQQTSVAPTHHSLNKVISQGAEGPLTNPDKRE